MRLALPAALLLLTACQANDNEPGVGGVTAGEARALNEAATRLDAQALPPDNAAADAPH
jgi:hypothetical protein